MSNKLESVKKAVEYLSTAIEVERMNNEMSEMIFSENKNSDILLKMQDELFKKRVLLNELEQQYKLLSQNN